MKKASHQHKSPVNDFPAVFSLIGNRNYNDKIAGVNRVKVL